MIQVRITDRTGNGVSAAGGIIRPGRSLTFDLFAVLPFKDQLRGLLTSGAIEVAATSVDDSAFQNVDETTIDELLLTPTQSRVLEQYMFRALQATAVSVNIHFAAAGGTVNAAGFSGAQPQDARNVILVHTGTDTADPYTIEVIGVDPMGNTVSEIITATIDGTTVGRQPFAYIATMIQVGAISGGDSGDIQLGSLVGLPTPITEECIGSASLDGVFLLASDLTVDPDFGTVDVGTPFVGTENLVVYASPGWAH